jgi:uncharacterized protein
MARPYLLTRRGFFRTALATVVGGLTGGYAYSRWIEPFWIEVVQRDLPITGLPPALDGQTLVQLSDLHVGLDVDDSYLRGAFREAAALNPDWVVVTGDYMTCQRDEQIDHVARVLEDLPHGRVATIGILGNHDYGHHYYRIGVADRLTARLEGLGLRMLRNQSFTCAGLTVVGLDDLWTPCFPGARPLLATLDKNRPTLVLCHNPDVADEPVWHGYQGWMLSGHTHGGQCKPPLFNAPFVPVRNKRYTAGAVDLGAGRQLYVNRGLGHLLQVRFNARPEITVFRLRREICSAKDSDAS